MELASLVKLQGYNKRWRVRGVRGNDFANEATRLQYGDEELPGRKNANKGNLRSL